MDHPFGWNFVPPRRSNESEAVEALALSLSSSFTASELDEDGRPTRLRSKYAGAGDPDFSIEAAEVEFTRSWAIAVDVADGGTGDSEFLDLVTQAFLIESVQAYMEVYDLGYMTSEPALVPTFETAFESQLLLFPVEGTDEVRTET